VGQKEQDPVEMMWRMGKIAGAIDTSSEFCAIPERICAIVHIVKSDLFDNTEVTNVDLESASDLRRDRRRRAAALGAPSSIGDNRQPAGNSYGLVEAVLVRKAAIRSSMAECSPYNLLLLQNLRILSLWYRNCFPVLKSF
jgi:hypothetical protein